MMTFVSEEAVHFLLNIVELRVAKCADIRIF